MPGWKQAAGLPGVLLPLNFLRFRARMPREFQRLCVPWGDCALPCPGRWPLMRRRDPLP